MSDALMEACKRIDEQSGLLDRNDAEIAILREALERIKADGDSVLRHSLPHKCDYYNYATSSRDRARDAILRAGKDNRR